MISNICKFLFMLCIIAYSVENAVSLITDAQKLQAFQTYDLNNDGIMTVDELEMAMNSIGLNITKIEMQTIMRQVNAESNGIIDFTEFDKMVLLKDALNRNEEMLKEFNKYDKDRDGFISKYELLEVITENASTLRQADADGDGKISFPEYKAVMEILYL